MKDTGCINCGNKNDYLVGDPIFLNGEQYLCCHCASLVKELLIQAQKVNDEKKFGEISKQILDVADEGFSPATIKSIKKYLRGLQEKKWGIAADEFAPKENDEKDDYKDNGVAKVLRVIGILEIIIGVIVGIFYIVNLEEFGLSVVIAVSIVVGTFIGGMLFIGFAEVISLLQKISDR